MGDVMVKQLHEPAGFGESRLGPHLDLHPFDEFLSDLLEGGLLADLRYRFRLTLRSGWIDAVRKHLSGLITTFPRLGERDIRVAPESEFALATMEAIFEPPQFRAGRLNQQKQSERVRDLVRLWPRG